MHGSHRSVRILRIDEHGDLDLARGDHLDVDVHAVERLEHRCRAAGMGLHARAHYGDLGDVGVAADLGTLQQVVILQQRERVVRAVLADGERDVLRAVAADGLQDDVDHDVFAASLLKIL